MKKSKNCCGKINSNGRQDFRFRTHTLWGESSRTVTSIGCYPTNENAYTIDVRMYACRLWRTRRVLGRWFAHEKLCFCHSFAPLILFSLDFIFVRRASFSCYDLLLMRMCPSVCLLCTLCVTIEIRSIRLIASSVYCTRIRTPPPPPLASES